MGDGFGGEEGSYKGGPKYENITSSANQTIADSIMKALISQYNERTMDVYTDIMSAYANIGKQKTKTDEERKALCEAMQIKKDDDKDGVENYMYNESAMYISNQGICKIVSVFVGLNMYYDCPDGDPVCALVRDEQRFRCEFNIKMSESLVWNDCDDKKPSNNNGDMFEYIECLMKRFNGTCANGM